MMLGIWTSVNNIMNITNEIINNSIFDTHNTNKILRFEIDIIAETFEYITIQYKSIYYNLTYIDIL